MEEDKNKMDERFSAFPLNSGSELFPPPKVAKAPFEDLFVQIYLTFENTSVPPHPTPLQIPTQRVFWVPFGSFSGRNIFKSPQRRGIISRKLFLRIAFRISSFGGNSPFSLLINIIL